ncbi:unnamed protein product [Closterium sp. NIES-53]
MSLETCRVGVGRRSRRRRSSASLSSLHRTSTSSVSPDSSSTHNLSTSSSSIHKASTSIASTSSSSTPKLAPLVTVPPAPAPSILAPPVQVPPAPAPPAPAPSEPAPPAPMPLAPTPPESTATCCGSAKGCYKRSRVQIPVCALQASQCGGGVRGSQKMGCTGMNYIGAGDLHDQANATLNNPILLGLRKRLGLSDALLATKPGKHVGAKTQDMTSTCGTSGQ